MPSRTPPRNQPSRKQHAKSADAGVTRYAGLDDVSRALIVFANQAASTSTAAAEAPFLAFASATWQSLSPQSVPPALLGFDDIDAAERHGQAAYRSDRSRLRRVLRRAARNPSCARVPQWVGAMLRAKVHPIADMRGQSMITLYQVDGAEAGIALGLAALISSGGAARLKECEDCAAFFLLDDGRQHAALRCATCAIDAQRRAAAARQQRYRDRQKGE